MQRPLACPLLPATKMAPLMASVEPIMAKCGDDEACITRESMKLGPAMSGTPQMAAVMSAKGDIEAASKQGSPRFRRSRAPARRGSYAIDESMHIVQPTRSA